LQPIEIVIKCEYETLDMSPIVVN